MMGSSQQELDQITHKTDNNYSKGQKVTKYKPLTLWVCAHAGTGLRAEAAQQAFFILHIKTSVLILQCHKSDLASMPSLRGCCFKVIIYVFHINLIFCYYIVLFKHFL